MIWITSDTHFNHSNIIKYANRPFKNVKEMNNALIHNWNSVVQDNDIVIHVGDFGFGSIEALTKVCSQLKGRKWLVRGNHDKGHDSMMKIGFENTYTHFLLKQEWIYLAHSAHKVGLSQFQKYMICAGHTHTKSGVIHIKENEVIVAQALDIGVDANNFTPVNLEQIRMNYRKKIGYEN